MNIVYLGSGGFGVKCLEAIKASKHIIKLVVTQPSRPAGRGRQSRPTAVRQWVSAQGEEIHLIETDDVNSTQVFERIAAEKPDLIVVIAFGQKIGNELIKLPPKGAVNVHASLLPKYRGAAPVNWAIINGEEKTGISIITLADKMDAGSILSQAQVAIQPGETAGQLHDRLADAAVPLLMDTIEQIADGSAIYTEQDHILATLAPKLKKSDGFLDFADDAQSLERKIRGLWPWPGASAVYISKKAGKRLRVIITAAETVRSANPDKLTCGMLDKDLNIICGRDALKVKMIKPDGSDIMDFTDFVNGRSTKAGDMFTQIEG